MGQGVVRCGCLPCAVHVKRKQLKTSWPSRRQRRQRRPPTEWMIREAKGRRSSLGGLGSHVDDVGEALMAEDDDAGQKVSKKTTSPLSSAWTDGEIDGENAGDARAARRRSRRARGEVGERSGGEGSPWVLEEGPAGVAAGVDAVRRAYARPAEEDSVAGGSGLLLVRRDFEDGEGTTGFPFPRRTRPDGEQRDGATTSNSRPWRCSGSDKKIRKRIWGRGKREREGENGGAGEGGEGVVGG